MTVPWARCRIDAENESGRPGAQQLGGIFCASDRWCVRRSKPEGSGSNLPTGKSPYYSLRWLCISSQSHDRQVSHQPLSIDEDGRREIRPELLGGAMAR
jgi:hypothetical protein